MRRPGPSLLAYGRPQSALCEVVETCEQQVVEQIAERASAACIKMSPAIASSGSSMSSKRDLTDGQPATSSLSFSKRNAKG